MSSELKSVNALSETWANELKGTIEMFTGQKADLSPKPLPASTLPPLETLDQYLWWAQELSGQKQFTMWFGAPEQTWSAIARASSADDDSDPKQLFCEMLDQACQGAASVLSQKASAPLRCEAGSLQQTPQLSSLIVWLLSIEFKDLTLPPIVMATEPAAEHIFTTPKAGPNLTSVEMRAEHEHSPMLSRLLDLELPLAVALGRATLPIHDILKMTSGSLIELDRTITEYVDLVVHGTVVARGEIVSVKGNYGVRIKEIISRQDRLALQKAA